MARKVLWSVAFAMLAAVAAGAEPGCSEADDLAWLLAPPTQPSPTSDLPALLDLSTGRKPGSAVRCYAQANCGEHSPVSCGGSGTCVAVDRDCGWEQRGYVTCDGNTTYCPPCGCPEGHYRSWEAGCCYDNQKQWYEERCENGEWVFSSYYCSDWCSPPSP